MSTIELGSQSVDFGVCGPGPQWAQFVPLSINTEQPLAVTIEMGAYSNAGFVATICTQNIVIPLPGKLGGGGGGVATTDLASTSGTDNSYTFPATSGTPSAPGDGVFVRIDFNPPSTPLPEVWSGVVTLSWSAGSTELMVSGTTAQLGMSIVTPQPIQLTPGGNATVSIKLEYDSVDASTVSVNVGPSTNSEFSSVAGLYIPSKTVSMPPGYVEGQPAKNKYNPLPGGVIKNQPILNVHRIVTFELPVTAGVTTEPGDNQAAYIVLTAPSLSEQIAGPFFYKALFNIPPLPVKISPPTEVNNLLAGTSIQVPLRIVALGAETTLKFGAATASYESSIPGGSPKSGPAAVTVTSGNVAIGSGTGNTTVDITVSAPANALGAVVSIALPWTAYDGALEGTTIFQVNLLPQSISLIGSINYAKLTGSYAWSLNANGYSYFSGNVHVPASEILSQEYAVGISLSAENPQNKKLIVAHSGTLGNAVFGTALGDDNDSWNDAGRWNGPNCWIDSNNSGTILAAWAQICDAARTVTANYSPDALDTVVGILAGVLPVEGIVAGIVVAFEAGITCVRTGVSDDPDDADWGDGSLDCAGGEGYDSDGDAIDGSGDDG